MNSNESVIDPERSSWQTKLLRLVRKQTWVIGILILLGLWQLASANKWVGKTLLASPAEVWNQAQESFDPDAKKSEKFHIHGWATIKRAMIGWGIGIIAGAVLALALAPILYVYFATEPMFEFIRSIPPILAFPLFLVAYDYGEKAYIATIIFGCVPIMMLTMSKGIQSIAKEPQQLLEIFGVNWSWRYLTKAIEVLPSFFLGARLTFSIALVIAVVTEMVFTPRSGWALGAIARDSEIDFDTPMFFACVVFIGIFGYTVNSLLRLAESVLGSDQA